MNCFVGLNGMGKTSLLDAVYYLSFCKSSSNPIDSQVMKHDAEFCVVQGKYVKDDAPETCDLQPAALAQKSESTEEIVPESSQSAEEEGMDIFCGIKRGMRKQVKRDGKAYQRYSEHVGLIPLVMVSPADFNLISGGSDERRRFMDVAISQYDKEYLSQLIAYEKALTQRNVMLKAEEEPDPDVLDIWEEAMADAGKVIYERRKAFIEAFTPVFRDIYSQIAGDDEEVSLTYSSHGERGDMLSLIRSGRQKERILGYSIHGVHKDELVMELGGFPMKREGSQGQNKTYVIALKLAQFDFLRNASHTTPILLLDDIFDRLDATRVEQIVRLVSGDRYGQTFITDVNRGNMDRILAAAGGDYKLYSVDRGHFEQL